MPWSAGKFEDSERDVATEYIRAAASAPRRVQYRRLFALGYPLRRGNPTSNRSLAVMRQTQSRVPCPWHAIRFPDKGQRLTESEECILNCRPAWHVNTPTFRKVCKMSKENPSVTSPVWPFSFARCSRPELLREPCADFQTSVSSSRATAEWRSSEMLPAAGFCARFLQPAARFHAGEYRQANVRPVPVETWDPTAAVARSLFDRVRTVHVR